MREEREELLDEGEDYTRNIMVLLNNMNENRTCDNVSISFPEENNPHTCIQHLVLRCFLQIREAVSATFTSYL